MALADWAAALAGWVTREATSEVKNGGSVKTMARNNTT